MRSPILYMVLAPLVFLQLLYSPSVSGEKIQRWNLEVRETAGVRRFNHPTGVVLKLSNPVKDVAHFRLLRDGKPQAFQIYPLAQSAKGTSIVGIDFPTSHSPFEDYKLVLEYDPQINSQRKTKGGIQILHKGNDFVVSRSGKIRLVIPDDLQGLVTAAFGKYISQTKSKGLFFIVSKSNAKTKNPRPKTVLIGGDKIKGSVVKNGPLIAALQFNSVKTIQQQDFRIRVDLEFPSSRSWFHVKATVQPMQKQKDNFHPKLLGVGAELNLLLEKEPFLVDFGAGNLVYARLRKGQTALLFGKPGGKNKSRFESYLQRGKKLVPLVFGSLEPNSVTAGWAHVMDSSRCTAVAVNDFPRIRSRIEAHTDGRLLVLQERVDKSTRPLTLSAWYHFVRMPPHIGAATSPQSMMNPPLVTVTK